MKTNKSVFTAFIFSTLFPILGVVYSFLKINDRNTKGMVIVISYFVFFFVLTVPPFQDLYRRYLENYLFLSVKSTYSSALIGHFDFIFYALSLFFRKNEIPFFYIPSIFTSLSVYMTLMSLDDLLKSKQRESAEIINYRFPFLVLFCFINIIVIALGLRFGLAVSLALRASTVGLVNRKKGSSYFLFILSCLTHFSMFFVFMIFLSSKFIKIKRHFVVPFSIVCAIFGGAVLPFVLSKFNLLGLSEYVTKGYVDGSLADSSSNMNAILISLYNYLLIFVFGYYHLTHNNNNKKFSGFINVFYISTFLIIISYTAFNRYFVGVGTFLLLLSVLSNCEFKNRSFKYIIIVLTILNVLFANIYVQRRPILLAKMWTGLYTPMPLRLTYNMNDFNAYLRHINSDGDWIGHEIHQ